MEQKPFVGVIHVGDRCVYCMDSVAWGSGKYVNRIPADACWTVLAGDCSEYRVDARGWMCADCTGDTFDDYDPDTEPF